MSPSPPSETCPWRRDHSLVSRLSEVSFVAHGGYGSVYSTKRSDGRSLALKVCPLGGELSDVHRILNEIVFGRALRHANVLSISRVYYDALNESVLIEYDLLFMDLRQFYKEFELTDDVRLSLLLKACMGVRFLHRSGMLHRDLKSDNILIERFDELHYSVRLCDYNYMCLLSSPPPAAWDVGTLCITAPECLCGGPATPASDLWSLGCVIAEVFLGRMPFYRETTHSCEGQLRTILSLLGECPPPPPSPYGAPGLCCSTPCPLAPSVSSTSSLFTFSQPSLLASSSCSCSLSSSSSFSFSSFSSSSSSRTSTYSSSQPSPSSGLPRVRPIVDEVTRLNSAVGDLVGRLLRLSPGDRPNIDEVMSHEAFLNVPRCQREEADADSGECLLSQLPISLTPPPSNLEDTLRAIQVLADGVVPIN